MRKWTWLAAFVAILAFVVYAAAQEAAVSEKAASRVEKATGQGEKAAEKVEKPAEKAAEKTEKAAEKAVEKVAAKAKEETVREGNADEMMAGCMGRMKSMGMGEPVMLRHKMGMGAKTGLLNPSGLLAIGEELKLTEAQTSMLQVAEADARNKSKEILNEAQLKMVQEMEGLGGSVMEVCAKMRPKMQKMMEEKGQKMMCPMCPMMQGAMPEGSGMKGSDTK